ncbi:MAG: hypothetical protein P0Y64_16915 [Candidatus Sphingomonas colombiensis]|nr:hypothetical protein [Sphingomonas sp.]WEK43001.1 MAG: hypothetical protein P0Y64_16915 [Sphingomonas sp.]
MRQVNRDELINIIQSAMRGWTKSLLKEFQHHEPDRKFRARVIAAGIIADKMQRLETLSGGCEPPGFRCIDPDAPMNPVADKLGVLDSVGSKSRVPGDPQT